jgi:hypothetical protein
VDSIGLASDNDTLGAFQALAVPDLVTKYLLLISGQPRFGQIEVALDSAEGFIVDLL